MRYVRAYVYDTANPSYHNAKGKAIQDTKEWYALIGLLYKLGIIVLY